MPPPIQPEKRKRGRPRKIPLPPVVVSNELVQEALLAQQQRTASKEPPKTRSEQYLLAAFAFFSFFNSPVSFSPASSVWLDGPIQQKYTHCGAVLGPGSHMGANISEWTGALSVSNAPGWRDAMQLAQLVLSIFMLFSFMRPRLLRLAELTSRSSKTVSIRIHSLVRSNAPAPTIDPNAEEKVPGDKLRLFVAARKLRAMRTNGMIELAEEAQIYREGLGIRMGIPGLLSLLYRQIVPKKASDFWQLERRAYARLAEIAVLDRKLISPSLYIPLILESNN